MTEHSGEHSHASKNDSFAAYVLPLSILLAAVIVGWSMMSSANAIASGLDGLTLAGNNGGNTAPVVPNEGNLAPTPTKTMAELSANAAGVLGSNDAPIVIVEYSDYQCPFCRRWFDDSKQKLVDNYISTGKVQLVFKDYPLSFHPMAEPSARAARCAGDQGKYWEMHDKMFVEQGILNATGTVQYTLDDLKAWAADLGVNESTFNSCLDNNTYAAEVQANLAEGSAMGVSGTPSFFIGKRNEVGQLVVGAQPYATFDAAITSLLG